MAKYDDMYMIVIDCICVLIKMIFHMFSSDRSGHAQFWSLPRIHEHCSRIGYHSIILEY